jgi:hypothetical protein
MNLNLESKQSERFTPEELLRHSLKKINERSLDDCTYRSFYAKRKHYSRLLNYIFGASFCSRSNTRKFNYFQTLGCKNPIADDWIMVGKDLCEAGLAYTVTGRPGLDSNRCNG